MYYPTNRALDAVFKEDFTNATTVGRNGGAISGDSIIKNGVGAFTGTGIAYQDVSDRFWDNYGSARIKFKLNTVVAEKMIMGSGDVPFLATGWNIVVRTGDLFELRFGRGTTAERHIASTVPVVADTEYDILIVWEKDNSSPFTSPIIYINGEQKTLSVVALGSGDYVPGTTGFHIGEAGSGSGGADMEVYDVWLSDRTRTLQEVLDDYNNSTFIYSPILNIPCKDKIGTSAPFYTSDISGNNFDATLGNGAGANEPDKLQGENGFDFVTTSKLVIPHSPKFLPGNNGAMEIWFKFSELPSGTHILGVYGHGATYATGLLLNQTGTSLIAYWNSGGPSTSSVNALSQGLNHIVMSNIDGAISLYVNGEKLSSGTTGGSVTKEDGFIIGNTNWASPIGILKKWKWHKEGLTHTQVKDRFYQGPNYLY